MEHDIDVFSRAASRGYDAYMIRRVGESTCTIIDGEVGWVGHYWNRADNGWNDYTMPRDIFTLAERDTYLLPDGGEWVAIVLDNGGR